MSHSLLRPHQFLKTLTAMTYLIGFVHAPKVFAQHSPGAQKIKIDLVNKEIKDGALVPYDVRVKFEADLPDTLSSDLRKKDTTLTRTIDKLSLFYTRAACKPDTSPLPTFTVPKEYIYLDTWSRPRPTIYGNRSVAEFKGILQAKDFFRANELYCLLIRRFDEKDSLRADSSQQLIPLQTAAKFSDYIKLDFGVGYSFTPRTLFGSIAVHLYSVPVNDSADLAEKFGLWRQLQRRVSLFAGIVPVTFFSKTKQEIKSATSLGNLIFGVGIRAPFYSGMFSKKAADERIKGKLILQSMRLNLGWLVFTQQAANSVLTQKRTKFTPYIGITYDFTLSSLLGPISKLFGAG